MLIIFDLDDTLIDTSGSVTPFKLQCCIAKLTSLGLPLPANAEKALLSLNATAPKSKDALLAFASSHGASPEQQALMLQELITPLPPDFTVSTTPNAKEILEFYRARYPLALVTGGHPPFQREKLKKAGVDSSIFSMISIPEDSVKKPSYEAVKQRFSIDPQSIWVCGDRIEMDLRPAFELGFRTVHMRWGRGKLAPTPPWIDQAITDLRELKEIIR